MSHTSSDIKIPKTIRNFPHSERTADDWEWEDRLDSLLEQDFYKIHCIVKTLGSDKRRFVEVYEYSLLGIKSLLLREITHEDNLEDLHKRLIPQIKLLLLFGG